MKRFLSKTNTNLQARVALPVLVQNQQQLLRAAQGEHRNQAGASARHHVFNGGGELLLSRFPVNCMQCEQQKTLAKA
jgi:hypothetical protein